MKLPFIIAAALFLLAAGAQGQPGSLIPAYGDNGHVFADYSAQNTEDEDATAVLIQADGKRVVVFDRFPYMQAIRFNADGSYDDTFGEGGFSEAVPLGASFRGGANAALQADGKIVAAGETDWNETTLTDFGVARWNTDGTLDDTFGSGGIATTNFGYWDDGMALLVQPDQKILVGGTTQINSVTYLAFARYNDDGTPDESFGFEGKHVNPIFDGVSLVAMDLTSDGKIMVLGDNFDINDFVLARFLSTGPIDVGFTADGYQEYDWFGDYSPFMECMELQPDDKILIGGSLYNGVNSDMVVARYGADGVIDNTFHGDGKQITHIGGSESVRDLVVQGDGMIVAAGRVFYSALPTVFALARYEADGDLDGTFGVQGTQITSFSGYDGAAATVVALHSDGDITAAGGASKNYSSDIAVATYDVGGTPDVDGFPVQRVTGFYADNGATLFLTSAVQPDGKVVAAGYAWNGNDHDFLVARFNTDGSPDPTFGVGGYSMTDFPMEGSGDELARSIAIQPDGKIVVSGQFFVFIVNGALPVARLNPDGSPDSSFDSDGIAEIDFPGIFEEGNGIVVQPDGKIVIGGSSDNFTTNFDFSLCRLNADGSLDADFGTGGMVSTNFGYQDIVFGLALQADGKILATGNTSDPNSFAGFDYCTVRYNADGGVDSGFGTDGRVTTDFDGGFDFAEAIALQADGKIVVGGGAPINDDYEFALARYTPAGSHDSSFGGTGRLSTGFGAYDIGTGVAVGGDGRITITGFAGGVGGDPVPVDVGLARYNSDGSVDALFGDAGKVKTDFDAFEWGYSVNLFDTTLSVTGTRRIFRDFTGTDKHFGLVAAYSGGAPPADEQVEDIITDIDTLFGVPPGTKTSLKSKLQAVLLALASGDTAGACRRLRAFVNEVNAQAGKKRLTAAQAAALLTDAERVMDDLGCDAIPPAAQGGPDEWEASSALPTAYALEQNSPNPFNPVTAIRYALPVDSDVRLEVYSMLGKLVATLVDANQPAGHHQASFDAAGLASGVYFYRIEAAGTEDAQRYFVQVGKMALIR